LRADKGRNGYSPWISFFLNLNDYQRILTSARIVVLVLSLVCCCLIFLWVGQAYGRPASCVAALLWLTDPNIIAHSSVATLDIGAAAIACLAVYAFWRFQSDPSWANTILAGAGLGLAAASKFSLMMLYPACLVSFGFASTGFARMRWDKGFGSLDAPLRPAWGRLALVIGLSVLTLDACFLFNGVGHRLDSFGFESRLLGGAEANSATAPSVSGGNRFLGTLLGPLPVVLPEDYLTGFDSQKHDEESRLANIRSGRLVYGGRWYSPLRTLAYKLPPGTILILAAALLHWVFSGRPMSPLGVVLVLPALIILGMLCTQTGLNWAYRYTIPALPFLFISSGVMVRSAWSSRVGQIALSLCLAWNIAEVATTRPYYLSYGNPIVGGMPGARNVFLGSNYDWGQDLGRLKDWCVRNPERAADTFILYYGAIDGRLWGVGGRTGFPDSGTKANLANASRDKGPLYFIISSNYLNSLPGSYRSLEGISRTGHLVLDRSVGPLELVERIGSTIFVFRTNSYEGQIYVNEDLTWKVFGTP